jgi:tetratricopeptide (TPR) repeat protein
MTAILVAFPVALALLILAYPPTPKTRAPATRARRWIQAVAAALAIACLGAAYRWGAEPAREILAAPAVFKGMANAAKGDHEAALRDFDRALALAPRWADPLAKRANSESALGRYDEALRDVDAAVLAWPRNADLLIQRAELHRHRHEPRAVVADLTGAVEIAPKSPVAWALRAEANTEAGDAVGARSDIARALALGPADLMALTVQAQMFLADGDFDSALRSIDSALGSHPDDPRALFLRGRILIYQREPEKAASDFARVSQSSKALYAPLWLFLAEARLGRDGSLPLWLALKAAGGQWPAPIAEQFLDHQTQARTREAAAADDQRCEADFYAGELYLAHDNDAPARELLQTAAAECPVDFIEREGAIAELRTLDADARVPRSAMPSAPAPTTPPPSAPRDESATATALASAGGHQFMVSAAWSFIDDGAEGGRLDVALALLDSPARGKLSLVKRVVSGEVSYEVLFSVPAGDRAAPPFSGLGKRLGIPLVHAPRRPAIFPSTSEFAAIDRDTYRLTLDSKKDVASALYLMAGGDQLSLLFNPDEGVRSGLTLELNSDTERVVRRAIDAWR